MHITTGNSPRLTEGTTQQAPRKTRRGSHSVRQFVPAGTGRRLVSLLCAGGVLGAVLAVCPVAVPAQVDQRVPPMQQSNSPSTPDFALRKMTEQMAKQRNTDRQKKIVSDTTRLLAMAQKLNDEVSHSTKNELSIDVVKQAAEIEKLAKSIKDKMRDGY